MAVIPQRYAYNADIKYPLSDFHESDVPNDLLLDLSISVPAQYTPVVGAIRVGPGYFFVSIEDETTRVPLAHLMETRPTTPRVYPLVMDVAGFGWVVLGPAAVTGDPYYSGALSVPLDPECVTPFVRTAPEVSVRTGRFTYPVGNVLAIESGSRYIKASIEGSVIYLERNDEVLSDADREALAVDANNTVASTRLLYQFGGVRPDSVGNVDIVVVGCAEACAAQTLRLSRGDAGEGVGIELPLDHYTDREWDPADPCAPSPLPSPSGGTPDSEECHTIVVARILERSTGTPVGLLLTGTVFNP